MLPLILLTTAALALPITALAAPTSVCSYTDASVPPIFIKAQPHWNAGGKVWCYNLGTFRPFYFFDEVHIVDAIQPVFPDGTVAGDLVFGKTPCDQDYSPAVRIKRVVISNTALYNSITTYAAAEALTPTDGGDGVHNHPIVPLYSSIQDDSDPYSELPIPLNGWFNGAQLQYYDFGRIPIYQSNGDAWAPAGQSVTITVNGTASGLPILGCHWGHLKTSATTTPGYTATSGNVNYVPENEEYPVEFGVPAGTVGAREDVKETIIGVYGDMRTLIPFMNKAIACTNYPPGNIRYLRASRAQVLALIPSVVNILLLPEDAGVEGNIRALAAAFKKVESSVNKVKKYVNTIAKSKKCNITP
ncbi:hypothetical protein BC829DRAFT_390496 [Chytridium lagenaria]|nr:hypothetical protein BC829DRAFT_390496 [Chytridium lagenaria]